jgi:hypothetical protein
VSDVSGVLMRPMDRIVVLDALRGACFVFMTADHVPGNPFATFSNPYFGPFGFSLRLSDSSFFPD